MTQPEFSIRWCDWAEEYTYARVLDGQAFCARCGSTDHEEHKP